MQPVGRSEESPRILRVYNVTLMYQTDIFFEGENDEISLQWNSISVLLFTGLDHLGLAAQF